MRAPSSASESTAVLINTLYEHLSKINPELQQLLKCLYLFILPRWAYFIIIIIIIGIFNVP